MAFQQFAITMGFHQSAESAILEFAKINLEPYVNLITDPCGNPLRFFRSNGFLLHVSMVLYGVTFYIMGDSAIAKGHFNAEDIAVALLLGVGLIVFIGGLTKLDTVRIYLRKRPVFWAQVAGAASVMILAVAFSLRVPLSIIGLASQFSVACYTICLLHVLDCSTDFGFIDYMLINTVERAAEMYQYNWRLWIIYGLTIFIIPIKNLILDLSPPPIQPEKGIELRDTQTAVNAARARFQKLEAKLEQLQAQQQQGVQQGTPQGPQQGEQQSDLELQ